MCGDHKKKVQGCKKCVGTLEICVGILKICVGTLKICVGTIEVCVGTLFLFYEQLKNVWGPIKMYVWHQIMYTNT